MTDYRRLNSLTLPAVLLLLLGAIFVGCGNEHEARPAAPLALGGAPGHGGALPVYGACLNEGEEKTCTVYLEQASGVTSCFTGIQFCEDGVWSDCLPND